MKMEIKIKLKLFFFFQCSKKLEEIYTQIWYKCTYKHKQILKTSRSRQYFYKLINMKNDKNKKFNKLGEKFNSFLQLLPHSKLLGKFYEMTSICTVKLSLFRVGIVCEKKCLSWSRRRTCIGWRLLGLEGSGPATTVISCPLLDCVWSAPVPTLLLEVVTTTTLGLVSTPTCTELPPFPEFADAARAAYWAPVVVMAIAPSLLSKPVVVSSPPPCVWMDGSAMHRYIRRVVYRLHLNV